tara:strand:+ start:288 stop:536 length:249 start_codon:yes stop_codon:yes gene_type:complete
MQLFEALLDDPVVQLFFILVIAIGIFDVLRLSLSWALKKTGGRMCRGTFKDDIEKAEKFILVISIFGIASSIGCIVYALLGI